jgi:hypothetical protein
LRCMCTRLRSPTHNISYGRAILARYGHPKSIRLLPHPTREKCQQIYACVKVTGLAMQRLLMFFENATTRKGMQLLQCELIANTEAAEPNIKHTYRKIANNLSLATYVKYVYAFADTFVPFLALRAEASPCTVTCTRTRKPTHTHMHRQCANTITNRKTAKTHPSRTHHLHAPMHPCAGRKHTSAQRMRHAHTFARTCPAQAHTHMHRRCASRMSTCT